MLLTSKMAFQVNCSTERRRPSLSENIDRFTTRFSSSYKVITPSLSLSFYRHVDQMLVLSFVFFVNLYIRLRKINNRQTICFFHMYDTFHVFFDKTGFNVYTIVCLFRAATTERVAATYCATWGFQKHQECFCQTLGCICRFNV